MMTPWPKKKCMVYKFCCTVFLALFTAAVISAAEPSPVPKRFKASREDLASP